VLTIAAAKTRQIRKSLQIRYEAFGRTGERKRRDQDRWRASRTFPLLLKGGLPDHFRATDAQRSSVCACANRSQNILRPPDHFSASLLTKPVDLLAILREATAAFLASVFNTEPFFQPIFGISRHCGQASRLRSSLRASGLTATATTISSVSSIWMPSGNDASLAAGCSFWLGNQPWRR
jgi:hypothetical protein